MAASRHASRRGSGTAPRVMLALCALCALCTLLPRGALAQLPTPPLNTVNNIEHDTESERTRRGMIGYTGFVFDFFTGTRAEPSANGFQVPVNSNTNAFVHTLTDHGNALNFLHLGPCAGNSPHTHPRGSEISSIVRGRVQFGFVEENGPDGNRLVVVDASAGQVVFIPQGLMHFSHNLNCEPAAFIANFGNRDPGTQTVWSALMAIPTPILAASLNIANTQHDAEEKINAWKKRPFVHAPATGGAQCLQKCGIDYTKANGFEPSQFDRENRLRLKFGPIVPTDQLGNRQNFSAGAVNVPSTRRDFVGFTAIPKTAGFNFLQSSGSSSQKAQQAKQASIKRKLIAGGADMPTSASADGNAASMAGGREQDGLVDAVGGMDDNVRVQAAIRKLESVLPKDRITVLDAKDIAGMEGDE